VGLLEKAGKIKDDGKPKKAVAKAKKATKATKADPKPVKAAKASRKDKAKRVPREARVMPQGFKLAGKASRFARRLVDFIVTYGAFLGVLGAFSMIDSDFTYFWIASFALMLFNLVFLPYKTNRSVGMFLTRTRYVNSNGSHPVFIHQILGSLTALYVMLSIVLIGIGAGSTGGANWTTISIGIVLALIVFSDYVVTKLRAANGETQSMYDAMFGCWFVVADRGEEESEGWMARLESLGDWGEKRGWSGSAADDEDAESND
jgi:hypothetical protein